MMGLNRREFLKLATIAGIGVLYDPDRLKYPMVNVGKRGEPKWKRISRDEAYDFIAEKMQRIQSTYGPEAIALLHDGPGGVF
jgi:thiosulfate reductase / polysulfide reductase chain A